MAALILSTAVVLTETLGLAMTYPVLTFIETGGNPDLFRATSKINIVVADALETVGLELSLVPLMILTFCLILVRQFINFFLGCTTRVCKMEYWQKTWVATYTTFSQV